MKASDIKNILQYQLESGEERVNLEEETPEGAHSSISALQKELIYLDSMKNKFGQPRFDDDVTNGLLDEIL